MSCINKLENRIGGQNLGNVISQILLCKQINPDFHTEELGSISKDAREIGKVLSEMQEFMPKQETYLGMANNKYFFNVFFISAKVLCGEHKKKFNTHDYIFSPLFFWIEMEA
jgi:hypothetical protein